MHVKLGPISLETPEDYMPRMFVMTAPEAEKPKVGMMVTKQAQTFARNFTVGTEEVDPSTTADQYAQTQLGAMKTGMPGFQLLKQSTVNIGGKDCPLFEIQSGGPDGRLLQALTAYFVHGKTAFTMTASQMAGLPFSEVKKEYLAIFSSAKLG